MTQHRCLRCKTVALTQLDGSSPDITFFECKNCGRQYALKPPTALTFRWLHPIALALYGTLFDTSPVARAEEMAAMFVRDRTHQELQVWTREIRLELDEPTQRVRDILGCVASEEDLRTYLDHFVAAVDRSLAGH